MNRKLKIALLVVLGLLGSCGAAIGAVFALTSGMVTTADQFFLAVTEHDLGRARGYLAEEFRASTSEAELRTFVARSALDQFKEAGWSQRGIKDGLGTLEGSITTTAGGTIPVSLTFVKENGEWRIYALRRTPAGLEAEPDRPSRAEAAELVRASFRSYAASVTAKDMSAFHASVSRLWKRQKSVQEFNEIFGSAMKGTNDFTMLEGHTPVIAEEPTLDENGVLLVAGHYPQLSPSLSFRLKYVFEGFGWKLVGLSYGIGRPAD